MSLKWILTVFAKGIQYNVIHFNKVLKQKPCIGGKNKGIIPLFLAMTTTLGKLEENTKGIWLEQWSPTKDQIEATHTDA